MKAGGNLLLRNGSFKGVRLPGAEIAGDMDFIGSRVTETLNAQRLEAGGNLHLRDRAGFNDVDLTGARIVGDVDFRYSTVQGQLDADGSEVGGGLNLRGGQFRNIELLGATIVGDVELNGSTVDGSLAADGLEVGGSLFLRDGGKFKSIGLRGANIGGIVQLHGSTFGGEFDMTGAVIGVELHLASGRQELSPTWQHGASLILRNAKADALQARADSWNVSGADGLLPTDLGGFTYNRLGGLGTSGSADMGDESAGWLVKWIEAQRDHGQYYEPQPYTQLAQVLEAAGATDKAKAILYARSEHKHDLDTSNSICLRFLLMLERYLVGYGIYPFRALCWFIASVLVGGVLAQFSKDPSVRGWIGLWYSLENSLPLIQTNERFKKVSHCLPGLDHFFCFQKALGFVLATVLVGALTLLGD